MARYIITRDSAANYRQKRVAIDTDYIRSGLASIASGVATVTVTFSSEVPSTNYSVSANLQSSDASPQFQPVTITEKTTEGFTAKWNANTDTANYVLNYQIMPIV